MLPFENSYGHLPRRQRKKQKKKQEKTNLWVTIKFSVECEPAWTRRTISPIKLPWSGAGIDTTKKITNSFDAWLMTFSVQMELPCFDSCVRALPMLAMVAPLHLLAPLCCYISLWVSRGQRWYGRHVSQMSHKRPLICRNVICMRWWLTMRWWGPQLSVDRIRWPYQPPHKQHHLVSSVLIW